SDPQIAAVDALHTPFQFGFTVANGVTQYAGWGWGSENNPANNWRSWVNGTSAAGRNIANFGNQFVPYFLAREAAYDPLAFTASAWEARIKAVSNAVDSTNPDLSAFQQRGGKLIISEHGGDYARSPNATLAYYDSVVARLGQSNVDQFARLYMTP